MIDKQIELIYETHCIRVKLLTKEGYFAFFWEVAQSKSLTMKEAWEETERELERQFNQSRYSSYESFMNMVSRERRKRSEARQFKNK